MRLGAICFASCCFRYASNLTRRTAMSRLTKHRFRKREAHDRIVIDPGDQIAGEQAGSVPRRTFDRRDHFDQAILHRHFDTDAAEFAAGPQFHLAVILGGEKRRMRVEFAQHPRQARRHQATKEQRIRELEQNGYPAYTTSAGWLGYSNEKLQRLCREAVDSGFKHIKIKVGVSIEDDVRRCKIARETMLDGGCGSR